MTISDGLMILAVLIAPILAVQVQKRLEAWKQKTELKKQIFTTLMATRATRLDPSHVTALNMIDLEFKEASVCEKWREYMDCLLEAPEIPATGASEEDQQEYQHNLKDWASKHEDKFIDLLYEMSRALGYEFDKVHLKKGIYYPRGLSDLELENQTLRRAALSFFSGIHAVNMNVASFPSPNENDEVVMMQSRLRKYALDLMEGKKSIPVSMLPMEEKK